MPPWYTQDPGETDLWKKTEIENFVSDSLSHVPDQQKGKKQETKSPQTVTNFSQIPIARKL